MSIDIQPKFGAEFTFDCWSFDLPTGQLEFSYHDSEYGDFTETFIFSDIDADRYQKHQTAINAAINCLFWMAGVSYYKTSLAHEVVFNNEKPSKDEADWLTQTWRAGLAELAFENGLGWLDHIVIPGEAAERPISNVKLKPRSLVAIGGGKDSLVSIEAIKSMEEPACLFMVGQSAFIKSVAAKTDLPMLSIERRVDTGLTATNQQGAFNGHIPITAINACVATLAALFYDYDSVVFSNERSADVGNVQADNGQWVNHQYSKSLAYEQAWQAIIQKYITPDLHCFSLLRPFSELAIVQRFAALKQYFPYFSSCNRNFHLAGSQNSGHHWCGECPKCAFVFLCLAPFVSSDELLGIFQKNLFDDVGLSGLFDSLLGIEGLKPFECVGEQQECRLAVALLAQHPDWRNHKKIMAWQKILPEVESPDKSVVMTASDQHLIPNKRKFLQVLNHEA
jgi:hypothetical protein